VKGHIRNSRGKGRPVRRTSITVGNHYTCLEDKVCHREPDPRGGKRSKIKRKDLLDQEIRLSTETKNINQNCRKKAGKKQRPSRSREKKRDTRMPSPGFERETKKAYQGGGTNGFPKGGEEGEENCNTKNGVCSRHDEGHIAASEDEKEGGRLKRKGEERGSLEGGGKGLSKKPDFDTSADSWRCHLCWRRWSSKESRGRRRTEKGESLPGISERSNDSVAQTGREERFRRPRKSRTMIDRKVSDYGSRTINGR